MPIVQVKKLEFVNEFKELLMVYHIGSDEALDTAMHSGFSHAMHADYVRVSDAVLSTNAGNDQPLEVLEEVPVQLVSRKTYEKTYRRRS